MRRGIRFSLALTAALSASLSSPARAQDSARVAVDSLSRIRVTLYTREHLVGRLVGSPVNDSLLVRRTDVPWKPVTQRTVYLDWRDVAAVDTENGRATLLGAVAGLGAAVAFSIGLVAVKGPAEDWSSAQTTLMASALLSLVTVPVGALIGSTIPTWKPAYRAPPR